MAKRHRNIAVYALQVVFSLGIVALLLRDAQVAAVWAALREAALGWLLVAFLAKLACYTIHEVRLWYALLAWGRPRFTHVLGIGYLAGLVNTVLPVRAGDMLAFGLLVKEEKVPVGISAATVALVGLLEAMVFGGFLFFLLLSVGVWGEGFPELAKARGALGLVSSLTLAAVGLAAVAAIIGRRLTASGAEHESRPMTELRGLLRHTGDTLGQARYLFGNVALAVLHLTITLSAVVVLIPAAGLQVEAPLVAAAGVLGFGALAAVVLPPGLGAGPAAVAVFVLHFFGVDEAHAIAMAALGWGVANVSAGLLGLPPLWRRLGALRSGQWRV